MEAPEKIYLQENTTTDCYGEFWPEWFEARARNSDIEYTRTDIVNNMLATAEDHAYFAGSERAIEKRTDAFIEKACEFLKDRIEHDSIDYPMATKHLVDDFKKYMKRE